MAVPAGVEHTVVHLEDTGDRHVELPAELADEGQAQGPELDVADANLAPAHEREGLVRQVGVGDRGEDLSRARALSSMEGQ